MSYELIPPETQAKDQLRWQGPPESKRPPGSSQGMSMLGPVPSIPAQVNPEAAAHLMAHYAESVQPAPEKDAHKAKEAPPHKGPGAHPEAKAKEPGPEIVHTGLGAKIDETAAKSSTLEHNLETLQKHGWVIKYGHKGAGTFADRNAKTITVDPQEKGQTLSLLESLAHESGHAMYTPGAQVPMDHLTRQQYIERNVDTSLKDEGEATITNMQVREELLKAKQGDIGVAGAKSKEYLELYKKYPQAKDRDKLREEIGKVFAHGEHPSNAPKKTYEEYYAKPFSDAWDAAHPPAHKP